MQALKVGDNLTLVFTKVIDELNAGPMMPESLRRPLPIANRLRRRT
jgi:hypothetical protein